MPDQCHEFLVDERLRQGVALMRTLVVSAYVELIRFGFHIKRKDFSALHSAVRNCRVRTLTTPRASLAELCRALDIASIWYWKRVLCLQRSAAATCLLRRHGIPAQLVIGTQQIPFNAHAWVEVDGQVVTDRSYMHEMYVVLEKI
jgi:hypothetical protein